MEENTRKKIGGNKFTRNCLRRENCKRETDMFFNIIRINYIKARIDRTKKIIEIVECTSINGIQLIYKIRIEG